MDTALAHPPYPPRTHLFYEDEVRLQQIHQFEVCADQSVLGTGEHVLLPSMPIQPTYILQTTEDSQKVLRFGEWGWPSAGKFIRTPRGMMR